MGRSSVALSLLAGALALHAAPSGLDTRFAETVKPFLATYCIACHSGANAAAQLDLRQYPDLASVVRDYPHWNLVMEKLSAREMPPKAMKQPPAELRQQVIDWVAAVRADEARKHAGDPGIVLARRLSNSEYNYTIRDLTGVDLQPTREFPVDPANPAGFDNSGESLMMSPALLNKYLQAARDVANHMALTPDGFVFAPYPMLVETDREKFAIQRIVNFYAAQPTDYADYFLAAWRYKHRSETGQIKSSLADFARESKVAPHYLAMIWPLLEETPDAVGPIAKLQTMWRALPAPNAAQSNELREQCVAMRDFVVRIRRHTAMQFIAPKVAGLPPASQPLMNYKYREFNTHRRDFDPASLRNDTDAPPVVPEIPKYPGLHQEAAYRWAAVMKKERAADPDLTVPAAERARYEAAFARFANVFPDAFYIKERGRYFPDDSRDNGRLLSAGYHNVMGYWRDDQPLMELILDEKGRQELDRLWTEFDFMSEYTWRTWVQYYDNESGEVQGRGAESGTARPADAAVSDTSVIYGLRDAYLAKAQTFGGPNSVVAIATHFKWIDETLRNLERLHAEAEPKHIQALLNFAARAYRRPLTPGERDGIVTFYHSLREKNALSHEEAIRDSLVSILMSPKFCYRMDTVRTTSAAKPEALGKPLSDYALASRLSYFLWSSLPDDELLAAAARGDLERRETLLAQARRMLKDERARAIAIEFGGNWLDFRRFEEINTVDRDRFPSFTNELRDAMFQEPVRYLDDVIRHGRSVLDLLYGDYTFVNPVLAKHYGMPDVAGSPDRWVRVDDAGQYGRGGLLPMAAFLTQNAPGLRTSPVKRGYWVVRRVLGEVIPPPPATVPELPHDEAKMDLPLRDILARHRANQVCAACHARFDSVGLAFEGYGPVGERRTNDLAGHPVQTNAEFPGGGEGSGFEGVRKYIHERREKDFVDNLSRKLLAYALGRSLMLSDDVEVEEIKRALTAGGYRFDAMVEAIVASPQFVNKRIPDPPDQRSQ